MEVEEGEEVKEGCQKTRFRRQETIVGGRQPGADVRRARLHQGDGQVREGGRVPRVARRGQETRRRITSKVGGEGTLQRIRRRLQHRDAPARKVLPSGEVVPRRSGEAHARGPDGRQVRGGAGELRRRDGAQAGDRGGARTTGGEV